MHESRVNRNSGIVLAPAQVGHPSRNERKETNNCFMAENRRQPIRGDW